MIYNKRYEPRQKEAMEDGEPSPLFAGFATQCSDGSYAGEVEQHKEHEAEGGERGEASRTDIAAIEDSERRDDGFFGRKARQETNRHLPIETERLHER